MQYFVVVSNNISLPNEGTSPRGTDNAECSETSSDRSNSESIKPEECAMPSSIFDKKISIKKKVSLSSPVLDNSVGVSLLVHVWWQYAIYVALGTNIAFFCSLYRWHNELLILIIIAIKSTVHHHGVMDMQCDIHFTEKLDHHG